jgi:hypothetical protein
MMQGVNCSQARAHELQKVARVYLSQSTGFWLRTDNLSQKIYTYKVYRTGDKVQEIPADAFLFTFEMTLTEASATFGIPYPTLAEWARLGKLDARRSGGTWLTTLQAIERATAKIANPPASSSEAGQQAGKETSTDE